MVIENQIPKTEMVCELKDEYNVPSFEEFMRIYESDDNLNYDDLIFSDISDKGKGYGPCKNTSCGCFCPKNRCDCGNPEFSIYKGGSQKIGNGNASGSVGLGGNSVSGDADFTLYRDSRSNGDLKVGFVSVGADLINGGFGGGVRASANIMSFKTDGFEVRAGVTLDTTASISSNGLELKLGG
jgi:hypothetical protein